MDPWNPDVLGDREEKAVTKTDEGRETTVPSIDRTGTQLKIWIVLMRPS